MNALRFLVVLLLPLGVSAASSAADQKAKTADGKDVILRDDGTWIWSLTKEKDSKQQYKGKRGTFALWLVPDKWKQIEKLDNPDAEVGFANKSNDVICVVIAERVELTPEVLEKAAIENLRMVDQKAKMVRKDKRIVNGRELLCMTMEAKIEGISWTMHGYFHTGKTGTIQVLTSTTSNAFDEARAEMETFLNGLELIDK